MTRKILLTGAFQYSEEQLEIIENLGWNITFVQNELEEVDFPVDEFEAVVCNGLFLHNDIRKFKKLKLVQATSAGLERLPIKYMEENGISYFNAKGVYSIPMAEWAVMNILMLYKNMPVLFQKQKAHLWEKERNLLELTGKTVVIVGFGDVGQEIAKRIKSFGVNLIVVNRSEVEDELIDKWVPLGQLNQILSEADVVITSIALTEDTKYLLDREQFSIMKKDSVLVNISRGAVINQKALIEQLDCGWFRGVALDVFEEEPLSVENSLWDMKRVIVTPHNSFVSDKASGRLFEIIKKKFRIEEYMYQFIELLRAFSAVIITNAHYENIYPISIIANGGLLGDVLFFAISGFCLYEIKTTFFKWYGKRIVRIYPAVWIITLVYLGLGFYSANTVKGVIELLIYPTYYHFVASIMVLYVVYYILISLSKRTKLDKSGSIVILFSGVLVIHCLVYLTIYDKSYYHIDSVYEPMIRFLFLEAMLIGGWMRENSAKLTAKFKPLYLYGCVIVAIAYFASKLLLVKYSVLAPLQIFNQIILLLLLVFIFVAVSGTEKNISKIPKIAYVVIKYISSITLEIYLVQYALIPRLNKGVFPLNFIIVTVAILIAATGLHYIAQWIILKIEKCVGLKKI